jgi:DNA polymerase I-like protein with 3'-5' exonuclease and polymerase domains
MSLKRAKVVIVDNDDMEEKLYERLKDITYLAVDFETSGFNPRTEKSLCLALSWSPGKAVALPLFHRDATWRPNLIKLKSVMEDNKLLIMHNGKFDVKFMRMLGWNVTQYFDTMLAHYMVDDEKQGTHALDQVAAEKGWLVDKDMARKYLKNRKESFEKVPLPVLLQYCGEDTGVTYALYDHYKNLVPKLFYFLVMPAVNMYADMELQGVKVDVEYVVDFHKDLKTELDSISSKLCKEYKDINWKSPTQICKYFYDELGLPMQKNWDGVPRRSVDKEALKFLKGKHPAVDMLREHRKRQHMVANYIKKTIDLRDENDFVHPDFLFHGTTTGRLSCTGINLMAIDRDDRVQRMFIGSGDCLIMEADYSQIELKLAAYLSGSVEMMKIFQEGRDFHGEMGAELYNKPQNELTETERVITKMVVFGVLYGRSAKSIADEWGISEKEAQKYIDMLFKRYPELKKLVDTLQKEAVDYHMAYTLQGRIRRWRKDYAYDKIKREAVNFPFQCVIEGTKVWTNEGFKNIENIVEGDYVRTRNGFNKVKRLWNKEGELSLVTLRVAGNEDVTFTEEHPIWVKRKNKYTWVKADDVVVGDIVQVPRVKSDILINEIDGLPICNELANVCGWFVSEGSVCEDGSGLNFSLHKSEAKYAKVLLEDLCELRIFLASIYNNYTYPVTEGYIIEENESNGITVHFDNKILGLFLQNNFGRLSKEKHLPSWVFNTNTSFRETLLSAYLTGDAGTKGTEWSVTTVSERLAYDVKLLLNSLGKCCRIVKRRNDFGYPTLNKWQFGLTVGWKRRRQQHEVIALDDYYECAVQKTDKYKQKTRVYNLHVETEPEFCVPYVTHNSLASDITLYAAVLINEFMRNNRLRSRCLWSVHDAIVMEIAPSELAIVVRAVKSLMLAAPKAFIPDLPFDMTMKIEVGNSWGDVEKYKEEKTEYLSDPQMKLWGYEVEKQLFELSDMEH